MLGNVIDVRAERDVDPEMGPFAEPRQVGVLTSCPSVPSSRDVIPLPTTAPSAMHQNEDSHAGTLGAHASLSQGTGPGTLAASDRRERGRPPLGQPDSAIAVGRRQPRITCNPGAKNAIATL